MDTNNRTPLLIAFVIVIGLFLLFGGFTMSGGMMSGGMMGSYGMEGNTWLWVPTLITLGLGCLLGWIIFAKKA